MPLPNLLAVFAHPDDESLSAGGVLARHAASGARTAVVTATWAEGTWRAAELADALRVLGAGRPRMLGYADAKVPESAPGSPRFCDAPLDEAVGRLVGHIREFRPDIVVTHDAYGGLSGHPDHVHAHRVTVLAVQAAGWGGLYPQAGAPWRPGALHLATHPDSAARALGGVLLRPGRAMYSVPDEWITAAVDVGPWIGRKLDAVLAHRSEVERGALPGRLAALAPEVRARVMSTEWYVRYGAVTGPARPLPGLTV
ncbi:MULTISPECIES: PIG-L deacetylase family protein [unclassified Streptomyces]|uniref:PIG-L deacetylase family protein n=1 Tax=unclassified Streptomyces TaxID=2593676 RepID=UPI0022591CFB|nr:MULTISPECIES: PIG-L deacetylase family protein [unclassified Streptomyces]MCX5060608.1 PIG-L family deacetylase [Streptomyces sp. NBC_00452]MCX5293802.1 PIG-L family deacetylase [Streptomyces sp. NBC_00183]